MPKSKLARIADGMIELDQSWGRSTIAFIMAEHFLGNDPYVTPDSLAARMRVSDDSARRWLYDLVDKKMVVMDTVAGRRLYRATEDAIREVLRIAAWIEAAEPQFAVENPFPENRSM